MAKKRASGKTPAQANKESVQVALKAHEATVLQSGDGQVELVNTRPPLRDVCAAWQSLMGSRTPDTSVEAPKGQAHWATAMLASRVNYSELAAACGHGIAVTYEAVREGFRLGILGCEGQLSPTVERYLQQRDTYAVIPPPSTVRREG